MAAPPAVPSDPVAALLATIRRAAARLDHLSAYDHAARAAAAHPQVAEFEHAAILALANSGATAGAERRLAALDPAALAALAGPFAALRGRLLKDRALAAAGAERAALAGLATDAYEAADRLYRDASYPAINAAATAVLAGDAARAARHARTARQRAAAEPTSYWSLATLAEAALILGDHAAANAGDAQAAALAGRDLNLIATTRRQRGWLLPALGVPADQVPGPPPPAILHWVTEPDAPAAQAAALAGAALALLAATPAGAPAGVAPAGLVFGALLGPADLAIAQHLLRADCRLDLVLPCADAIARAGLPAAEHAAFDHLLAHAGGIRRVTFEGDPAEPTLVGLSRQQARGNALLRGMRFDAPVYRAWLRAGQPPSVTQDPGGNEQPPDPPAWRAGPTPHPSPTGEGRSARALVFGDVRGYSRLREAEQLAFVRVVIGGFADVLARCGPASYAETAGDGLYVVFDRVETAAAACAALHAVVTPARLAAAGLPAHLRLRLSAHVGPVFRVFDRVIGRERFCGLEVVRTARIEPVTPPGETYVTEQFAAALVCADAASWTCDYVGIQPMAKGFGDCRMYALRVA